MEEYKVVTHGENETIVLAQNLEYGNMPKWRLRKWKDTFYKRLCACHGN